jgi:hypothetical protein
MKRRYLGIELKESYWWAACRNLEYAATHADAQGDLFSDPPEGDLVYPVTIPEEPDTKIAAFIEDVVAVEKKHGLSLSHEDGHGAFMVEEHSEGNEEWLKAARDNRINPHAMDELNKARERVERMKERAPLADLARYDGEVSKLDEQEKDLDDQF